ncbi:MAG: type III pantothenate kinase [Acidobacteriota bacterium]|jgi:type III pantothenate kinase|nr:type III pantothenate kinase [Acidobacteriota bacterium]
MLLTIDIGNTGITLGLFKGGQLGPHWRLASDNERTSDEYGILMMQLLERADLRISGKDAVRGVAIASVVPTLTGVLARACRDYMRVDPLIVDAGVRTGIPLRYEDPRQIGADRVINAVAVRRLYKCPACVVDFGTATTFDALSADGEYLGGAIAPGIGVAADALFRRAAKLPRVDICRPPSVIGRNTVHSMQSGLLYGYVGLVEGMVSRFRAELGPEMKTIGTGAMAELIAGETGMIDIVNPWLALEGLKIIFELSRS